jgi:hypothetical protein
MPRRPPISTETSQAYATRIEFCRVFAENMDGMHLLSFLLTADQTKAEECFVSGLEDCVEGTYVFRDWGQSWARMDDYPECNSHVGAPQEPLDRCRCAE